MITHISSSFYVTFLPCSVFHMKKGIEQKEFWSSKSTIVIVVNHFSRINFGLLKRLVKYVSCFPLQFWFQWFVVNDWMLIVISRYFDGPVNNYYFLAIMIMLWTICVRYDWIVSNSWFLIHWYFHTWCIIFTRLKYSQCMYLICL